jgi:hypothetical protein
MNTGIEKLASKDKNNIKNKIKIMGAAITSKL